MAIETFGSLEVNLARILSNEMYIFKIVNSDGDDDSESSVLFFFFSQQ